MSNPIIGELADFAVAELEANKPAVLSLIQAAEGGVEGAIVNALKNAPKPPGLLGTVFPIVEAGFAKYAQQLVAKYGPEVVFNFIDTEAHVFAKQLGG